MDLAYAGDPASATVEEGDALIDKLADMVVGEVRAALGLLTGNSRAAGNSPACSRRNIARALAARAWPNDGSARPRALAPIATPVFSQRMWRVVVQRPQRITGSARQVIDDRPYVPLAHGRARMIVRTLGCAASSSRGVLSDRQAAEHAVTPPSRGHALGLPDMMETRADALAAGDRHREAAGASAARRCAQEQTRAPIDRRMRHARRRRADRRGHASCAHQGAAPIAPPIAIGSIKPNSTPPTSTCRSAARRSACCPRAGSALRLIESRSQRRSAAPGAGTWRSSHRVAEHATAAHEPRALGAVLAAVAPSYQLGRVARALPSTGLRLTP